MCGSLITWAAVTSMSRRLTRRMARPVSLKYLVLTA
jgi:hypothetical protein